MRKSNRLRALISATSIFGIAVVLGATRPASALTFNFTYDPSLNTLSPTEVALVKDSVNYVGSEFSADFSNPVTLNININYDPSVGLASSSASYDYQGYSYAPVRTALLNNNPGDAADLPASDPTSIAPRAGSNGMYSLTTANEKALGLAVNGTLVGSPTSDGQANFGPGPWTFYPDQPRGAAGLYDFTSSMEHEISELMGRQSLMSQSADWGYGTFDLMRYGAAGVRSFDPTTNADGNAVSAYFSLDNGTTNLMSFNDVTGGDIHDWAGGNHDSFDAFGPSNDPEPVTAVDLQAMEAIGWTAAVPEPASLGLIAFGAFGLLARRRRGNKVSA
jgi:hypothetical protein